LDAFHSSAALVLKNLKRLADLGEARVVAEAIGTGPAADAIQDRRQVEEFAAGFKEVGF
jgi:hypothetical protein